MPSLFVQFKDEILQILWISVADPDFPKGAPNLLFGQNFLKTA